MINLLPPAIKEEIKYSKYNAIIIRYLKLVVFVCALLAGILLSGRWYLNQQITATEASIKGKEEQIAKYKELETKAQKLNQRINSIQAIQKSQSKFSVLLADLAQNMPQGTSISSISLTGDDKKPVRLTVKAVDYKTALGFRDSITKSKRIGAADIDDIKKDPESSLYTLTMTFSFNPGQAK